MSAATSKFGIVEAVICKGLTHQVNVAAVENLGEHLRLVTLEGRGLEGREWIPGDIVQIMFPGWKNRAYTPCSYDAKKGHTKFLAYVHGEGIGSTWVQNLRGGEACFVYGPRRAVDLASLGRPALVVGDESSLSTAIALRATRDALRDVTFIFEAQAPMESRSALAQLGVVDVVTEIVACMDGDAHHAELERHVLEVLRTSPATRVVLTGKAGTVQRLYKSLRSAGMQPKQSTNFAYWAPGRDGFKSSIHYE